MSGTHTHMYEVQKKMDPVHQAEQRPAPQVAYQGVQVSGNDLRSADLLALQRTVGNHCVQRILQSTLLSVVQRTLSTRRDVQQEIARITGVAEIPLSVSSELLQRLRLRRRLLTVRQRREQLAQQHIRCFPNGDCGFVGLTQSEFTTRDSRLIDQIQELQDQVIQSHSAPVQLRNVGLGVGDPLGRHREDADAIRLAETTYVFEEGEAFRTETRWRERRGFPQLPQERPQAGLVYLFVAVTSPTDIAANTLAAANTTHSAVRANTAIFNANEDWGGVEEVDSIDAFISLFARINALCQRHGWRVRQLEVFSHGGLDGPMFGLNRRQFDFAGASERGARSLSALALLPFTGDAVAFFRGCRVGAGNFLAAFAQQQGVATYGFGGTTSFSTRPGAFHAWQQGEPAYQLEFPGSETVSQILGEHPTPTAPHGYVPERTVEPVQRKAISTSGRKKKAKVKSKSGKVSNNETLHLTENPPYCCAEGKKMRSPAKAKADYDAKVGTDIIDMNLSVTATKEDGTQGPTNIIKNAKLSASVKDSLEALLYAASAGGVEVKCDDSGKDPLKRTYRSLEGQWLAFHRRNHDTSRQFVAIPGTSNHGTGKAIDFQAGFDWLLANAGKYGWVNLPTENWHYDHVSTQAIIGKYRAMIRSNAAPTRKHSGGTKTAVTSAEKTLLNIQYDAAEIYSAVVWNKEKKYSPKTWLNIQQAIGMADEDCSETVDEKTIKAVIAWQKTIGLKADGKVGSRALKALSVLAE